jgi:hypothetical protein
MIEHDSHIKDLALANSWTLQTEGASVLADALARNSLPHLKRLSLAGCNRIGDAGFAVLLSALERNKALVELRLGCFSERSFLAFANSLPAIKALEHIEIRRSLGLAAAIPSMLEGLRKNTSLVDVEILGGTLYQFPPTIRDTNTSLVEVEILGGTLFQFPPTIRDTNTSLVVKSRFRVVCSISCHRRLETRTRAWSKSRFRVVCSISCYRRLETRTAVLVIGSRSSSSWGTVIAFFPR